MPERLQLPGDQSSYESPDGDILPFADIEEPQPERVVRSEEFAIAEAMITEAIRKAKEGGHPHPRIEYVVEDRKSPDGKRTAHMSLAQFFGGNMLYRMVTKEEYDELRRTYRPEATGESDEPATTQVKKVGAVAASSAAKSAAPAKSAAEKPVFKSGQHIYADRASAAAGDRLDDD